MIRRFDDLGKIHIPKEIRKQIFGSTNTIGEPMEIFVNKNEIVLRKYEETETCEWEQYGYKTLHSKEHDVINPFLEIPESMDNEIKYCPYCGKKIKIID